MKKGFKVVRVVEDGEDKNHISVTSLVPVSYIIGQSVGRPIVKIEKGQGSFITCGPLTVFGNLDDALAYKEDVADEETDAKKGRLAVFSCFYTPSKETSLWVWEKHGTGGAEPSPFPETIFADSISLIEEV